MKDSLIAQAHVLKPIMQIGKAGITQGVIDQLDHELEERSLVKVKLLKTSLLADKKVLAQELATKTGSELVQVVGYVVVLFREKKKRANK